MLIEIVLVLTWSGKLFFINIFYLMPIAGIGRVQSQIFLKCGARITLGMLSIVIGEIINY